MASKYIKIWVYFVFCVRNHKNIILFAIPLMVFAITSNFSSVFAITPKFQMLIVHFA